MTDQNDRYPVFDFSELLPDDNFFYSEFRNHFSKKNFKKVFVEWGPCFPWTFEDRLAAFRHIDEKTITAFSSDPANKNYIVPLLPFLGGMDFILSFQSFRHLRLGNNASAINPEAAGARSFLEELTEDYSSLMVEATDACAFNMSQAHLIDSHEMLRSAASLLSFLCGKNTKTGIVYLFAGNKGKSIASEIKRLMQFENIICVSGDEINEINSPVSYLEKNDAGSGVIFEKSVGEVWELAGKIKTILYRMKYMSGFSYYNTTLISAYHERIVEIFLKIVETADIAKAKLEGRLNCGSISRYYDSVTRLIKKELILIENDIENIKSGIKGG